MDATSWKALKGYTGKSPCWLKNTRFLFLSLLLATAQATNAQTHSAPKDTIATRCQLPGADCALFPAAVQFESSFEKRLAANGRFTPTRRQVVRSEKALPSINVLRICAHPIEQNDIEFAATLKDNLKNYRRQYYGFYNSRHEPCFYINFFGNELRKNNYWLKYRIHIVDAGFSIWAVYYNLTNKTFYNFNHELSNKF